MTNHKLFSMQIQINEFAFDQILTSYYLPTCFSSVMNATCDARLILHYDRLTNMKKKSVPFHTPIRQCNH
jgi:hypothetical protein